MTERLVHHGGVDPDPSLPAVVLLHGAGMDHTVWRGLSRHLANHGRQVLAPDLPGHGRSGGPPLGTIDEMACWVRALLDERGIKTTTIIGHSLGGLVALRVAAGSGGLIDNLIMIGSGAQLEVHPELQQAADVGDRRAVELILSWSFGADGRVGGRTDPGTSSLVTCRRVLENGIGVLGQDLRACSEYLAGEEDAGQIDAPCLVVSGSEDRMVRPAKSARLAGILKNARYELVLGGGHMLMVQQPDRVRRLVDGVLPPRQVLGFRADV